MPKNKIKKLIFTLLLVLLFIPHYSYAVVPPWPDIIGQTWGDIFSQMLQQIQNAILGSLKQAALQTMTSTVNSVIGGGAGGPLFITNWNDYLISAPSKQTNVYINTLLTQTYAGKNSSSYSYGGTSASPAPAGAYNLQTGTKTSSSLASEGAGGNYFSFVQQVQQGATSNNSPLPAPDIQNYTSNPSQLFANGWTAPIKFFANPSNTELGLETNLNIIKLNALQQQQMSAQTQAIANQGFKPVMKGNTVVTPGSSVASMQASTQDLGNKMLAGATSVPEVISALVTRLVVKTATQGIANVQKTVQSDISGSANGNTSKSSTGSNPQNAFKLSY